MGVAHEREKYAFCQFFQKQYYIYLLSVYIHDCDMMIKSLPENVSEKNTREYSNINPGISLKICTRKSFRSSDCSFNSSSRNYCRHFFSDFISRNINSSRNSLRQLSCDNRHCLSCDSLRKPSWHCFRDSSWGLSGIPPGFHPRFSPGFHPGIPSMNLSGKTPEKIKKKPS